MYKCEKIISLILYPGDEISDDLYAKIENRYRNKFSKIKLIKPKKGKK